MVEVILVTCASGKIGSHLVPLLYNDPKYSLRLIVHSEKSYIRLQAQWKKARVIRADLSDPDAIKDFVSGASTIFHIGPSFHPHETVIGYQMIDAAVQAGVKHFIFSSVIQSQLRKLLNHDCKRYVEEYLFESGLNYTILQPTHFMDVFPTAMLMKQENPAWPALYDPNTAFSFIALRDYAEASAKIIRERDAHFFATYPLVSTLPIKYTEVVESVGKQIGKEIRIERKPSEEAVDMMAMRLYEKKDIEPRVRDGVERLLLYYNRRGLAGNPFVLENLLGRKATSREELTSIQIEAAGGH